jgi:hypothetical protein
MPIRQYRSALLQTFTWATKPTTYPAGQPVFISDYGTRGSWWTYDSGMTRWKPFGRQLLKSLDASSATIGNTSTIKLQQLLPAAGLQLGDRLEFTATLTKSGTTDNASIKAYVGTLGTTSDTSLLANTTMSASQQSGGFLFEARIESATSIQVLNRNDLGLGGATTLTALAAATIPNISNALYVSIAALSGGGSNTVIVVDAQIWLKPSSS